MKIMKRKMTIRNRIFVSMTLLLLSFSLACMVVCSFYFSYITRKEIFDYSQKIVQIAVYNIDSYFARIQNFILAVINNDTIINCLKTYGTISTQEERLKSLWNAEDYIQETLIFNDDIDDIILIGKDGYAICNTGKSLMPEYNFFSQPWFKEAIGDGFSLSYISNYERDYYVALDDPVVSNVSAVIPIINFKSASSKHQGYMIFNLNIDQLAYVTDQIVLEKTGKIYILDDNDRLILYRTEDGDTLENIDREYYEIIKDTSGTPDWSIIALIPKSEIAEHITPIYIIIIIIFMGGLTVVTLVSVHISRVITKPLNLLMEQMRYIEYGNLEMKLYNNSSPEIETFSKRMNQMIERINALNKELMATQLGKKDAEIKALQSQINPHFLFNTLQCIKALAVCERTYDVSRISTMIGAILRYAISDSREFINIREELEYVKQYIEIQNYRYPEKINYKFEVEENCYDLKCIKFMLQPIVENAIQHGMDYSHSILHIIIKVQEMNENVLISVKDDGKGISQEKLCVIRGWLSAKKQQEHIGIKNVHDRLRLNFGEKYGLWIESTLGQGTKVTLLIPWIREENL